MKPAIILGVGGTGRAVVDEARAHLLTDTATASAVGSSIRFMAVDTDADALHESRLPPGNRLWLGGFRIHEYVPRMCKEDPHFREWWDCTFHPRINTLDNGSGIVRRNGRLGLYRHFETAQRMINTKLHACCKNGSIEDSGLVVVTGSLCGGTGSALFVDLACVARHFTRNIGVRCDTVGVFALPSIHARFAPFRHYHDFLFANGYATLTELRSVENGTSPFNGMYAFGARQCRLEEPIPHGVFDSYRLLADRDGEGMVWKDIRDYLSLMADEIVRIVRGGVAAPPRTTAFSNVGRICAYAPDDLQYWKSHYDNVINSPERPSIHTDKRYG